MMYSRKKGIKENLHDAECILTCRFNPSIIVFKGCKVKANEFKEGFVRVYLFAGFLVLKNEDFSKHFKIVESWLK